MEASEAVSNYYEERCVKLLTNDFIKEHKVIVLYEEDMVYNVGINDVNDIKTIDLVKRLINNEIHILHMSNEHIQKINSRVYKENSISLSQLEESLDYKDIKIKEDRILNAPAVVIVSSILKDGVCKNASDIHLDPNEECVICRYRIDGILYDSVKIPIGLYESVVSRIKIMSNLNISEKRNPQDGKIKYKVNDIDYDFRTSFLPTVYGEKVVIRILDNKAFDISLKSLGYKKEEEKLLVNLITKPYGIILITGPTGCGKSTTLYSFLNILNNRNVNIMTIEDPVEYTIKGVNQIQVNEKVDLTFSKILKSVLRQDPDIIMIGEIRDEITARMAIRMSITGHLVFSTIHTNDSIGVINRLLDLGIEPFFIADALSAVISQRLVRKLCPKCKKQHITNEKEMNLLKINKPSIIYEANGCEFCNNTGYNGRTSIHEILVMNKEIKKMIINNDKCTANRTCEESSNLKSILDSCIKLVVEGVTSIEELYRSINDIVI